MRKRVVWWLLGTAVMTSASYAQAVPQSVSEPLPLEDVLMKRFAESDQGKKALAFVMSLTTFQDHENKGKYYYSPTFRLTPNEAGAATVVTNAAAVKRRSDMNNISFDLEGIKTDEFTSIRSAYNKLTARLTEPNLTDAERNAINASRAQLKKELDTIMEQAKNNQLAIPGFVLDSKLERMADLFGMSGFPVSLDDMKDVAKRTAKFALLSNSNGGLLSGNMFSGFTVEQLEQLRLYKTLRADLGLSPVQLAVLPVENIGYFSLAETFVDSKNKDSVGVPLFRSFAGSGNLQNATFNFDLTLDGAEKFSAAPPPIIIPVGIRADLVTHPPTFKVKLSCDFRTGWSIKGRADVKDGLIIYNDDLYTTMVAKSVSETTKPCKFTAEGGQGNVEQAAYAAAVRATQERLMGIYFDRVSLSKQEKEKYWAGVQADIAAHRHQGANSGWANTFFNAVGLGFVGTVIGALGNASQFYWYTNVQNIESLEELHFEEEIVIDTNQKMNVGLGTGELCLAWNTKILRFLACTPAEVRNARSVNDAFSEARQSCDENQTTPDCAQERNMEAPVDAQGNINTTHPAPPPPEVSLPDHI